MDEKVDVILHLLKKAMENNKRVTITYIRGKLYPTLKKRRGRIKAITENTVTLNGQTNMKIYLKRIILFFIH